MSKVSKKKEDQLMIKRAKRAYRNYVAEFIVDSYLDDAINPVHGDEILDGFIIEQTGGKRGSGVIRALLQNDVNKALKEGLKLALKEGVPGVLMCQRFFDVLEDHPEKIEAVESVDDAAQYVAGAGAGREAVGVLYVYSDEDNPYWACAHNHKAKCANGMVKRVQDDTEAGVKQKLPGHSANSSFVKQVRGNVGLPLLEN